ncbi:MAG: putative bicarbonate transporter, IctB family, partial [Dolichospermum sp.]
FLWLIVVTINTGLSNLRQLRQSENTQVFWLIGAIAVIIGILSHGLVDTVFYRPEVNTLWWFTVALVASFWQPLTLSKQ